jgi:hypothetical protein
MTVTGQPIAMAWTETNVDIEHRLGGQLAPPVRSNALANTFPGGAGLAWLGWSDSAG